MTPRRIFTPRHRFLRTILTTLFFIIGTAVIGSLGVLFFTPNVLFDRFIVPRIITAAAQASPSFHLRIDGMHYHVLTNTFGCDSVLIQDAERTMVIGVHSLTIAGVSWISMLMGRSPAEEYAAGMSIGFDSLSVHLPAEHYLLHAGRSHLSVPDSVLSIVGSSVRPEGDDAAFFASFGHRMTRYRVDIPSVTVTGAAFLPMFTGAAIRVRTVHLDGVRTDILVNKEKQDVPRNTGYMMPAGMLASIGVPFRLDTVMIGADELRYGERSGAVQEAGVITFDRLQIRGAGIANAAAGGTVMDWTAEGRFMRSGAMTIRMRFPVASTAFTYDVAGTLGGMDLPLLDAFLAPAEHLRLKGNIRSVNFDVAVRSGVASGAVRADYRGLRLDYVDAHHRERGFSNALRSFMANTFALRSENLPDRSGRLKPGTVRYTVTAEDPFFRFSWLALRSGVGDIAGF